MNFTLNKKFYSKNSAERALHTFKEFCDGKVEEHEEHLVVILSKTREVNEDDLKSEFCNHCLANMKD
jgi:hypothetical protein